MTVAFNLAVGPLSSSTQSSIFFSLISMASIAMCAYIFPMNHISKIFGVGQKYEGNFRSHHTRTVLNCEAIALLHGERDECMRASYHYRVLQHNKKQYYYYQSALMFLKLLATITQPNIGI